MRKIYGEDEFSKAATLFYISAVSFLFALIWNFDDSSKQYILVVIGLVCMIFGLIRMKIELKESSLIWSPIFAFLALILLIMGIVTGTMQGELGRFDILASISMAFSIFGIFFGITAIRSSTIDKEKSISRAGIVLCMLFMILTIVIVRLVYTAYAAI